jgi:hypothetical protein
VAGASYCVPALAFKGGNMKKDTEYNPKLKIDDIVYVISDSNNEIRKLKIQGIIYEKYKNIFGEVQKNYFYRTNSIEELEELREDKLGKEFFIKEEDAKKMLKKLMEQKKKEKEERLKEDYERIKKEYEEFVKNKEEK